MNSATGITACVLVDVETTDRRAAEKRMKDSDRTLLQQLADLLALHQTDSISSGDWRTASGLAQKTYDNGRQRLYAAGYITGKVGHVLTDAGCAMLSARKEQPANNVQ
jgi:hypothetical protein